MFLLTLFSLSGCAVLEMAQTWQLDRLRILATQSEPAEAQPGETVSMRSLTFIPDSQELEAVIWFGCLPTASTSFGCTVDPSLMENFENPPEDPAEQEALFQELQEAGLLGVEPVFPPQWTIPENALDNLSEEDKVEGLSAIINITAIPKDSQTQEDIELAFRRMPISLNPEPNQNPSLTHFLINGVEYAEDDTFYAKTEEVYELNIVLPDESIEEYTYINIYGVEETRTEEPYFTWYAESGTFDQYFSLFPYNEVDWTAPSEAHTGKIILVVRDRRGGMNWSWLQVEVTP
jgi:hypothetical protein